MVAPVIVNTIDAAGLAQAVSTANPLPVLPPVKTLMNEMSGLAAATGTSTYINIDLGALAPYYSWVIVSFQGIASAGSVLRLKASSDNVNFYYLPKMANDGPSSDGLSASNGLLIARTVGYRYLRGTYYNSSGGTAQTDMYLMLAAG